jgi:hypothetical protein
MKKYIDNDLKILQADRFLELEKVLTKRANKQEIKTEDVQLKGHLIFDFIDRLHITKYDYNKHGHYASVIPLVYPKDKPKTMEEFIKKRNHDPWFPYNIIASYSFGTWKARYEFSMNFIALFLDECFFSSSNPTEEEIDTNLSCSREGFEEESKILKYFLAELYEHAALDDLEADPLHLNICCFSASRLDYIACNLECALDLFYKLIVNGPIFSSDKEPQPRYRDICKYTSFNILLKSLKEYDEESATKLMTLISSDFTSFVSFFCNASLKALSIENTFNNEYKSKG